MADNRNKLEKFLDNTRRQAKEFGIGLGMTALSVLPFTYPGNADAQDSYDNKQKKEIVMQENPYINQDKLSEKNHENDFVSYTTNDPQYESTSTQSTTQNIYNYTANPFVQPNDTTLNWYGSGDADGDNKLTNADLVKMQEYIDGTYTPNLEQDLRAIDRMDINGDEVVNQQDYNMMQEHMQNRAPRDPEWYWANLDEEGKEAWLGKIMDISKIENTCEENGIPGEICNCNQYSTRQFFDFHGTDDQEIIDLFFQYFPLNYKLEDMNRFNVPNYKVISSHYYFDGTPRWGHSQGAVTVGDNFLNFSDLYILDDQFNAKDIQPGEWGFALGDSSEVRIRGPPKGPGRNTLVDYANWEVIDGVPKLRKYQTYLINLITEKPSKNLGISTNIDSDSIYEVAPGVNININDENLKFAWLSSDNGLTKKSLKKGNNAINNLNLSQGENQIWIYAKDIFDRDTLVKRVLNVNDIYAPRINITSPNSGQIFEKDIKLNASVSDPNINSDSVYYYINDNENQFFNGNLNQSIEVPYGEHVLSVVGVDKLNNKTTKKVNFSREDLTPPEINWSSEVSGTYSNNITFNWDISDENFQNAWLSKNGEKQEISQTGEISFNELPNRNYEFWMGAKDIFGNADSTSKEFQVVGVGLEDKLNENKLKVYPNPVKDLGVIGTPIGKNLYLKFYDMSGRLQKEIIDNDKDGKTEVDFSNYKPGMYVIRASDENKVPIGTLKVIKK